MLLSVDRYSLDVPSASTAGCHWPGSSCLPKARPAVRVKSMVCRIMSLLEDCTRGIRFDGEKVFDYKSCSNRQGSAILYPTALLTNSRTISSHFCNVPQREERDRHDGHDVVRVLRETCNDQCTNSDDRGTGRYYGYPFATSARYLRRPMRLF